MKSVEEWARGIFDKLWRNQQSEPARQSIMEEAVEAIRDEQRGRCVEEYGMVTPQYDDDTAKAILKAGKEVP